MIGFARYPARFRVDDDKVCRYPLDHDHEDGGPKCAHLIGVGFRVDDPVALMKALIERPAQRTLTKVYPVQHGLRYHFEGPLRCPGGITANVRTVWQVEGQPELYPARFITLKPLRRSRSGP